MTDASASTPTAAPEETPVPRGARRRQIEETVVAAFVVLLGIVVLVGSFQIRVPETGIQVGPRVFPVMVSVILLVSGLMVLISVLRGRLSEPDGSEDIDPNAGTDWRTVFLLVGIVAAQVPLIPLIGWALSAAVLFTGIALVLGARRWWLTALIGLAMGFATQLIFGVALGLSLPVGSLFENLLP